MVHDKIFEERTEMEVVFLCVSDENEAKDNMPNSCSSLISIARKCRMRNSSREYERAGDGFFPKYLRLYHPKRPPPVGSGAGPFGSFA